MRFLNRIVFLNSAHIPYSEVKLDGNVHFIGTQGVGKSTLLRAILFFYNADKQKLGIPKEKKGFDTFYFPYPNSYIIYEVMRPEGAFCVVALKSQGRTMFRFIDAPYERDWFVHENGEVPGEWNRIRERIGKAHDITPLVQYYDDYRDIIYGNTSTNKKLREYARFYLFESSQYQNIPRTIQNVFLNSKLDADFIKDTIIHSMNNDEAAIKLDFYRHQIKAFEQEYSDVKLWSERKRNGEIPVRKVAQNVIDSYYRLLLTQQKIKDKRCELQYAEKQANERLPLLQKDLGQIFKELNEIEEQLDNENRHYKYTHEELIRNLGVLDDKLKTITQKRKTYEELNILELIQRVQQEEVLKEDLKSKQKEREQLTHEQQNIVEKYQSLSEKAINDFERFRTEKLSLSNNRRLETSTAEKDLLQHRYEQEKRIRTNSEQKLQQLHKELQEVQKELDRLKTQRLQLQYNPPYQQEIEHCRKALEQFDLTCAQRGNKIKECQTEIQHLRKESEYAATSLRQKFEHEVEKVELRSQECRKETEEILTKLEQQKDSLSAWLEQHKPDWKQNIGKVINEDRILYATHLQPRLSEQPGHSLYGVELDLSDIPSTALSPEDLLRRKNELEKQIELFEQHKAGLRQQLEIDLAEVQKPLAEQVNEWLNRQHLLEQQQKQEPEEKNSLKAELIDWEKKRKQQQEETIRGIEEEELQWNQRRMTLTENERDITRAEQAQLQTCLNDYEKERTRILAESEAYCQCNEKDIAERLSLLEQQKKDLKHAEQEELKGNGVDMDFLTQIDSTIDRLNQELRFIHENRKHVIHYENDKADWFDHETDYKLEKEHLETQSTQLDTAHENKSRELTEQNNKLKLSLSKLNEEKQHISDALSAVRKFRSDTFFCPPSNEIYEPKETGSSCQNLVDELKSDIAAISKDEEKFRKFIHEFNGYFSPKNTFHFNQNLTEDKDYYDFAAHLADFIENDVISDFEDQISRRYIDIIRNLSREMSTLTNHESDIEKIISAINRDFIERNFAGVIKQIALRTQPSSDKLVQLLTELTQFYEQNEYNLGDADLFHQDNGNRTHLKAVKYLLDFAKQLIDNPQRQELNLSDTFRLEFRIKENDNDTGWTEKISNVGSEGTDILVKAMVNIMLINVFKEKASRKKQEFRVHCMMDEIGKLHPTNVKGILDFANCRNILLVNCSPTSFNAADYKYTYLLRKDNRANTTVIPLLAKQDHTADHAQE